MNKEGNIGKKNRLMQYGVLVIALMMIVSSGVYATIFITDEGSYDSDYDDQYVTGEESTYIMWRNADTYYCRSGLNGSMIEKSDDGDYILQKYFNIDNSHVFIKNGVYILSETINMSNVYNVTIEGESWNAVIKPNGDFCAIRLGDMVVVGYSNTSYPCENILFKDFKIDGSDQTGVTTEPETNYAPHGISICGRNTININIDNVYVYNTANDGIYGYNAGNVNIRNCLIEGVRGYWGGIHIHQEFGSKPWKITNNMIKECAPAGIRHSSIIVGNTIIDTKTSDSGQLSAAIIGSGTTGVEDDGSLISGNILINTDVTTYSVRGIRSWGGYDNIIGNKIYGFKLEAINTGGNNNINIIGNYLKDNQEYAIHIYQSNNITVMGNHIVDFQGSGKSAIACRQFNTGSYKNISIINNMIDNSFITKPSYCLDITNNYSYVFVMGNTFMGFNTSQIRDNGIGTIFLNNPSYEYNSLFPYYKQDAEPTLIDNSTAYWYETDTGYLYQIINTYGDTWYTNFTKTI